MIQWREDRRESRKEKREDGTHYYPYYNLKEVICCYSTLIAGVTTLFMSLA